MKKASNGVHAFQTLGQVFVAAGEQKFHEGHRIDLYGVDFAHRKGGCEIDLLKVGLSGIVKRYGFQNVHDFYKTLAVFKTANAEYRDKAEKWEEKYGENTGRQEKESVYKRLQNH